MDAPVLLTGSEGRVGRAILDRLGEAYEWRLLDREPPTDSPHETVVGDVTDEATVRSAVEGVGTVIHLAADSRPEAAWESVLQNNIDGTHTVIEAAVDAGVEKLVFASSNYAVSGYETERTPQVYRSTGDLRLDGSEYPRPSTLYGVSKVTGEVLCRYAHDQYGISTVCVRIGNLTAERPPRDYERGQAMWLSHRDCAHLFERCLEADYGFEVVYGISDNDRKFYDLERAREVLGYEPRDNSAEHE